MNRQDVENTVAGYLKPIYGFALKRCRSQEDAEDLAQEIALKIFRTLPQGSQDLLLFAQGWAADFTFQFPCCGGHSHPLLLGKIV